MMWLGLHPRNSLQARLSRSITLAVTLMWLAASLATVLALRHEMDEVFDSALQEVAQRVLPLAYQEVLNRETPGAENRIARVGDHDEYLTYLVRDASGAVLIRSHDADPAVFPAPLSAGFLSTADYRFYTVSAISQTLFVTAAEPLAHRNGAMWQATRTMLWPLLLLLPLCGLGVWGLVRLTLHPVRAFQAEIGARGRGNLTPVAAPGLPEELAPLQGAVNTLMTRLRRALDAERSFTASSAHELRTPIAAALAQTQRLIAELPHGPAQDRAAGIEAALKRLAQLSAKLLDLAKAEGAGLLSETPQDLGPVLGLVVQSLHPQAGRLTLTLPPHPVLSVIDPDAFAILARNLIENALKHGAGDKPVTVSLSAGATLSVVNGGPPIDAASLARLRQPFERGGTTALGTGLGLAIVEAIAAGIGTTLTLVSPAPGQPGGVVAQVCLPDAAGRVAAAI